LPNSRTTAAFMVFATIAFLTASSAEDGPGSPAHP
jgi:hypothetical protein